MPAEETISRRNLDGYGAPVIEWNRVREAMTTALTQEPDAGGPDRHTPWLATVNPDGSPHVVPVGVVVVDGTWCFSSGPGTRKARNLAADPRCAVTVATHPFDLVVEGTAVRVTDPAEVEAVAAVFAAEGWPARAEGDALTAEFSAPSAGPPPWHVYRVAPATVFALGTAEPYGATRFDLAPPVGLDRRAADEAAIRSLVERWAESVHTGDLDAVLADHADDIVMFDVPPPHEGVRGLDAYRETWPPFFEWQRQGASFEIVELEVTAGGDVAFAHALLRCGTTAELEANPDNRLRLTLGLRRAGGRWVVTHEHHSFPAS
jgi:uncharacterized protein (TIGR02246 family)